MRKYLIGGLIGFVLALPFGANADEIVDNIIGKTVEGQFPVKIEGKALDTQAAVIDGTSYLPVRSVGEALNMDVSFDADMGIELKEKEDSPVTDTSKNTTDTENIPEVDPLRNYDVLLKVAKSRLESANAVIEQYQKLVEQNPDNAEYKRILDANIEAKAKYEKQIAEYEAALKVLESQQ